MNRSLVVAGGLVFVVGATRCAHLGNVDRADERLELNGAGGHAPSPGNPAPVQVPGSCQPTAGGPYWIEEGQTLLVDIKCRTGRTEFPFVLDPLPRGATFDARAGHLVWTPALDQASVYHLTIRVPVTREVAHLQIGVADRFDDPANLPLASAAAYAAEVGLPVMHLRVTDAVTREGYSSATITYRGHVYRGAARLRGSSSLEYPKKNYTLKFAKGDPFNEPELFGGLPGRRRIVLITTFDDNSYIRHRLAFEVWNRLNPTVKIRHFPAVVYVNGRYNGLYIVADHVDADLLAAAGLPRKANLYKALDHVGNFFSAEFDAKLIAKKDGTPRQGQRGSHDDLRALFNFVVNADVERFRREIGQVLSLPDYRAWLIAVLSMQATDTLGKNVYHFHDPAGGPWRAIPWDFNASFGQSWNTFRENSTLDVSKLAPANFLFKRWFEDPVLGPELRTFWRQALEGPISRKVMLGLCEEFSANVRSAGLRDQRRWGRDYASFSRWSSRGDLLDSTAEASYVCQWIGDRWNFLLETLK